jgi:hypothetical protein
VGLQGRAGGGQQAAAVAGPGREQRFVGDVVEGDGLRADQPVVEGTSSTRGSS